MHFGLSEDQESLKEAARGFLSELYGDGPADKAGLEPSDIVVSINGEKIRKTSEAMKTISEQQPGTVITLAGYRKNVPFTARVQIMQRPGRVKPKDRL